MKMRTLSKLRCHYGKLTLLETQPCVRAVIRSSLSFYFKEEVYSFIHRNIIPDCGRVAPNCLKAHMIRIAKEHHLSETDIKDIKNLFKARIGYNGYYLDAGKLRSI